MHTFIVAILMGDTKMFFLCRFHVYNCTVYEKSSINILTSSSRIYLWWSRVLGHKIKVTSLTPPV